MESQEGERNKERRKSEESGDKFPTNSREPQISIRRSSSPMGWSKGNSKQVAFRRNIGGGSIEIRVMGIGVGRNNAQKPRYPVQKGQKYIASGLGEINQK